MFIYLLRFFCGAVEFSGAAGRLLSLSMAIGAGYPLPASASISIMISFFPLMARVSLPALNVALPSFLPLCVAISERRASGIVRHLCQGLPHLGSFIFTQLLYRHSVSPQSAAQILFGIRAAFVYIAINVQLAILHDHRFVTQFDPE